MVEMCLPLTEGLTMNHVPPAPFNFAIQIERGRHITKKFCATVCFCDAIGENLNKIMSLVEIFVL
jgi:hypothetical protein